MDWQHKKKIGPLAYVVAGLKALRETKPKITVAQASCLRGAEETHRQDACATISGELILIGNGMFYGGSYGIFPGADLRNGLLEICVVPRVDLWTLLRCAPDFLFHQQSAGDHRAPLPGRKL